MNTLRDNADRLVTRLHIEGRKDDADTVSALIRNMQTRDADVLHWIAQWNELRVELEDLKALRRRQIKTEEVTDSTNDIDALLKAIDPNEGNRPRWDNWETVIFAAECTRYHRALTALVAERDALRIEVQNAKTYWRERAERRDSEQREAADRDMRERLVCAIWPEMLRHYRDCGFSVNPKEDARDDAIAEADKMLDAIRKGNSDGQ